MFQLSNAAKLRGPWTLSRSSDPQRYFIPKGVVKDLKIHHVNGIEFLFHSYYRKKLKGVILNEDEHFNCAIQVAAFLCAVSGSGSEFPFMVCIICPDQEIITWHYHITNHAGLKVILVNSVDKDAIADLDGQSRIAVLIPFSNIKIAQELLSFNFFSVIVDDFDLVSNKRIFKNLVGKFNIAITKRNFYLQPDSKKTWTMLNWANPNCVGKLKPFYKFDSDNLKNLRDNYRQWWLRLTWNFCETFQKPSELELQKYSEDLQKWAKENSLPDFTVVKPRKRQKRSRETKGDSSDLESASKSKKRSIRKRQVKPKSLDKERSRSPEIKSEPPDADSDDSSDTIIYSHDDITNEEIQRNEIVDTTNTASNEENDLGNNIANQSSDDKPINSSKILENTTKKSDSKRGLIFSLLENKNLLDSDEEEVSSSLQKRNQLYTQIFNEDEDSLVLTCIEDSLEEDISPIKEADKSQGIKIMPSNKTTEAPRKDFSKTKDTEQRKYSTDVAELLDDVDHLLNEDKVTTSAFSLSQILNA